MAVILNQNDQLSGRDTQTNYKIPFQITKPAHQLTIFFQYGPDWSDDHVAQHQVAAAIERYVLPGAPQAELDVANYLPIENFITLSLSKDGNYLGAHHNKAKSQQIQLSAQTASLGFWPVPIAPGEWELQLNCHCIASERVDVQVRIEVDYDE